MYALLSDNSHSQIGHGIRRDREGSRLSTLSSVTTCSSVFPEQFKMIYRLAFIKTHDGYLKVTASAKGTPTLVAIHLNPHMLAFAARIARVKEEDVRELISMSSKAWAEGDLEFCCEAIDLEPEQLTDLGFSEDWRRLA
jgi:hypothetical protein